MFRIKEEHPSWTYSWFTRRAFLSLKAKITAVGYSELPISKNGHNVFRTVKKNHFYNPLKQNATHCAALSAFLGLPPENIYSYIIFSQRCELKKVPEDSRQYTIVRRPHLLKKLRQDITDKVVLFTHAQVDEITGKLQNAANVTPELKQQHVAGIKSRTAGTVCPFCGAQLVIREGKYGKFYGCSTYPKCKFTRKIP